MTANAPKKASDILRSLNEFILGEEEDVTLLPPERIQSHLKAEGIDPMPLVHQVRERIAKEKAKRELAEARERRLRYASNLQRPASGTSSPPLREKIREMLDMLKPVNPELAAVYYRKFEEATEDDLASMLEDLSLLEQMDGEDAPDRSK